MAPRRVFTEADRDQMLVAAGVFRDACVDASRRAPPAGPEYAALHRAMTSVDDLVGALTGNRELFWAKPHTTW